MNIQTLLLISLFTSALACALLMALWLQNRAMQEFRRSIACDLHDEVGASLSNISLLIELVSREIPPAAKGRAREFLERMGSEADSIHSFISNMLTITTPSCQKLGQLAALVNRQGYEWLQENGIAFSLALPQELREINIPLSCRHHFYLLIKEALHNIMKHSSAGKASVQFRADFRQLYCIIQDNGHGFDASKNHSGTGIGSMKRRAAAIKGHLEIVSSPGKGCTLQISLPLIPWWHPAWHLHRSPEMTRAPIPQAEKPQQAQKQWEAQVH